MNRLPIQKRAQILRLLVEGNSLRSITRIMDVSIVTVTKLLVDAGRACADFHENTVININAKRVQGDEIWSWVGKKQKNVTEDCMDAGDIWTWVAIDADTKLIISWVNGARDAITAESFIQDLKYRTNGHRFQLTTDGLKKYIQPVDEAFGEEIDYAQLVKQYGTKEDDKRHQYLGAEKRVITGSPREKFISTSYMERQNLTTRMSNRRFTRETNAFSKKVENHCHAVALNFVYYNFCRIHSSLSVTPAMQAGLTKKPMKLEEIVQLINITKM